jgi:hypothetical protein
MLSVIGHGDSPGRLCLRRPASPQWLPRDRVDQSKCEHNRGDWRGHQSRFRSKREGANSRRHRCREAPAWRRKDLTVLCRANISASCHPEVCLPTSQGCSSLQDRTARPSKCRIRAIRLLIKCLDDQDPMVVFRLTELGRNLYDAVFRSHSGRWDLMPGSRPLDEMAQGSSRSRSLIYRQITIKANLRDPVLGCSDGNSRTPFDIGSF